jgi:hypothetical protein
MNVSKGKKFPVLTSDIVLFTSLSITTGAKGIEIIEQIHYPLNSSPGK